MIHFSAIVPYRGASDELRRQTARVAEVLRGFGVPFEILLVEDGPSGGDRPAPIELDHHALPSVRFLRLNHRGGLSAALSAGIAAARGEVLFGMAPDGQFRAEQIGWLVERLSRADLVVGRRPRPRWMKAWLAAARLPRRLFLGLDARDPDCLFWAARREAVERLTLSAGMHRFLAPLVAARGYRVCEIHVDAAGPSRGAEHRFLSEESGSLLAAGNLLYTWWQRRNARPIEAREAMPHSLSASHSPRIAA
jgi:glycosyltransferase involved in cell wall biosynthesis